MEWEKIIKEQLAPYGLGPLASEVLKLMEEYKKKYPESVAYAYAMAQFLSDHDLPPLIDVSFIEDVKDLLKALGGRVRPARGSPYDELLGKGLYTCAAMYAYESERAALIVANDDVYIFYN